MNNRPRKRELECAKGEESQDALMAESIVSIRSAVQKAAYAPGFDRPGTALARREIEKEIATWAMSGLTISGRAPSQLACRLAFPIRTHTGAHAAHLR